MKRIILLCVSLALICSCFVISGSQNHVKVGAGFGFGEQVKEPEELLSLMEFIYNEDFGGLLSSDNESFKAVTLSGSSDYDSVEDLFSDNEDDILGSLTDKETSEESGDETSDDEKDNKKRVNGSQLQGSRTPQKPELKQIKSRGGTSAAVLACFGS